MIIKLKSFSALIAKLLQPLNFLTLSNDKNPAKPRQRPFEQSLFLFFAGVLLASGVGPGELARVGDASSGGGGGVRRGHTGADNSVVQVFPKNNEQ